MSWQEEPARACFRERVRAFAEREIAPRIRQLDAEERFDPAVLGALADEGLLGICIPRRLGGLGLDYHHLAIAFEELERVDTSARVILSVHLSLNSLALYQWGTPRQWERWLGPQARGEKVAAFALTEPEAGTDAASIATRAVRVDGGYRLSGTKAWIGLADIADHFLLFATLDPERKHRGVTAFLVRRGAGGLRTESITGKHGIRAGNVGRIYLEDVFVPEEDRLGEEGEGFQIAMSALDNGRFGVAAGSVGIIRACLEACMERCRERRSFGQEIGRHQLVQQMLARMVAARDVGRLLVDQAAAMKCAGVRHTREVSLAKWINCDAALQSASDAVQIFGAHGYSNEYPVERHLRNCRAAVIYEGTREIHQVIQAEYLLGYRYDRPLRRPLPPFPFPEDDVSNEGVQTSRDPETGASDHPQSESRNPQSIKVVDFSAIQDGRVEEIRRAGFLEGSLYIPASVRAKVEADANAFEQERRRFGRRAATILERLVAQPGVIQGDAADEPELRTDETAAAGLIRLTRQLRGTLVTTDSRTVAQAEQEGVPVLNVNELAHTMTPVVLPGDHIHVCITREGKEPKQGIAYLDDGTMVIVEEAAARIGDAVWVTVVSVLRTVAGTMIFGNLKAAGHGA